MDPHGEAQPLFNEARDVIVSVNGEIYNHKELRKQYCSKYTYFTESDCEAVVHMYEEFGPECVAKLDGDFAFCLADKKKGTFLAARDPLGVASMYYGFGLNGSMWFASELKALKEHCPRFFTFPPGQYYTPETGFVQYFKPQWLEPTFVPTTKCDLTLLRTTFENAVRKRMMTDTPYGVLLSGGLDSSLVCAVAARYAAKRQEEGGQSAAWWPALHTFSIGLKGVSSDLPFAKKVSEHLNTVHHEFTFTVQQGLDALRDLIYHLETFDVTTIRASTPMYLLSRKIRAMGVKMVLSGEGSDEIFGGYLYFHLAPNGKEMQEEIVSRVKNLHLADNLRANKSTMAWSIEARVPFLDQDFLDVAMNIDPVEKMHRKGERDKDGRTYCEKYILRKAFDGTGYLPEDVLWRQKEQFSDGVGYSWIDKLKEVAEAHVTEEQMKTAHHRWPHLPPKTKEAFYYREIFDELFPERSAEETVQTWVPKWSK